METVILIDVFSRARRKYPVDKTALQERTRRNSSFH